MESTQTQTAIAGLPTCMLWLMLVCAWLLPAQDVAAANEGSQVIQAIDPALIQRLPGIRLQPIEGIRLQRRLTLSTNRQQAEVGQQVQFQAGVQPPASSGALYYFFVNGRLESGAQRDGTFRRQFSQPGTYRISAKANLGPDDPELQSNTVTVTVTPRQQQQYSLELRALSATRIRAGEQVAFSASLRPSVPDGILYSFRVNGQAVRGDAGDSRYRHRFAQPGSYRVTASARPNAAALRRLRAVPGIQSNTLIVEVEPALPPPPEVAISPRYLTVVQGEPAEFSSAPDPDSAAIARYAWRGPDNQASGGRRFSLVTDRLAPTRHVIRLEVRDEHGRRGEAQATLEIRERAPPRQPPPPEISISPRYLTVVQGEPAEFASAANPDSAAIARYAWKGPDNQASGGKRFSLVTDRLAPTRHGIRLEVRDVHGQRGEAQATLEIRERPVPYQPPRATIAPKSLSVRQGEPAVFTSRSTVDRRSGMRIDWQGPGNQSGEVNPFAVDTGRLAPGRYDIHLTVRDDNRAADRDQATLEILPPPGVLEVDFRPRRATVPWGEVVRFRDSSRVPDGLGAAYAWQSAEGLGSRGSDFTIDTAHLAPGDYPVELGIRLEDGRAAAVEGVLTVQPPELRLRADRREADPGETVRFDAGVPDSSIRPEYVLQLGDDNMVHLPESNRLEHRYAAEGEYGVRLVAWLHGRPYQSNQLQIRVPRTPRLPPAGGTTPLGGDGASPGTGNGPAMPGDVRPRWWADLMNPWPWILALGIAISGIATYRLLRQPPPVTSGIVIVPVADGNPEIGLDGSGMSGPRIVLVRDSGEQSWEPPEGGDKDAGD